MNRNFAPSDTLDLIQRLPVGALLKVENKAFTNRKFQEITGFCLENPTSFEECLRMLFGKRTEEMRPLFERDYRKTRITSILTPNGGERWIEWQVIQSDQEEILLLWDITHLWKSRVSLINQNRQLEDQLFERTEDLEKAVNLLLSNNQQVEKHNENNQLLAGILSINQQLLKVLTDQLYDVGSPVQATLEQCAGSLQEMQDYCLDPQNDESLQDHLQYMQKLLTDTLGKLKAK